MERQKARGQDKDYFEQEKALFYENLVTGYREMSDFFSDRIKRIAAEKSPQEVTAAITQDLEMFLL
jgi:thymidylate kinase